MLHDFMRFFLKSCRSPIKDQIEFTHTLLGQVVVVIDPDDKNYRFRIRVQGSAIWSSLTTVMFSTGFDVLVIYDSKRLESIVAVHEGLFVSVD